jgi:hypothetical protein
VRSLLRLGAQIDPASGGSRGRWICPVGAGGAHPHQVRSSIAPVGGRWPRVELRREPVSGTSCGCRHPIAWCRCSRARPASGCSCPWPGAAVEVLYPVNLRACPVFSDTGLMLFRGKGAIAGLPRLPALAIAAFARVELRKDTLPGAEQAQADSVAIAAKLVPASRPAPSRLPGSRRKTCPPAPRRHRRRHPAAGAVNTEGRVRAAVDGDRGRH